MADAGRPGLLMVTGHYSNFEIMGYLLGLFDFNIYSIARPLDNKFINKYLYGVRRRAGQNIIDKKGAAELMGKMASTGATLCFIADQDAGKKGIFVDFFGRKASTYKSIGLIAITYNIPICIGYSRRVDNRFYFEIGVNRLISPEEWAEKDDPLKWVTAEYTRAIEEFVRQDPTQYWWLHRRWKHRPKEEIQKKPEGVLGIFTPNSQIPQLPENVVVDNAPEAGYNPGDYKTKTGIIFFGGL